ncbi:cyclic nucleotide-binding domain-containing protein [Sphingomonas jatrophae]|nr:cyclic nucleotide-binding domain-containing protein [Sphingomonas jatrophae]
MNSEPLPALLVVGGIILVAATCFEKRLVLRGGLALAAFSGLAGWVGAGGGMIGAVLLAGLLAVNLFHLALIFLRDRRLRFSDEEARMAASVFSALDKRQARHLMDQGIWIDGKAGESLTRENEPVSHLFYLSEGTAEVTSLGMWIATLKSPTLIGEVTVLDETGATATVSLDQPARFWCVPAVSLRRFLSENPDIRTALENSFAGAMAEKLRSSNQSRSATKNLTAAAA